MHTKTYSVDEVIGLLRQHDINPTAQRVEIARVMFSRGGHFSAEDVFALVNMDLSQASKATVYNTLGLFAEQKLIRPVIVDPAKVFYDANTMPHYHFYDVTTGMLSDINAHDVQITGLPPLPEGLSMEGVDVIVRVRRSASEAA